MQKCTICEKAIYGHPTVAKGLVCGSCTLTKPKGSVSGKTMFQVRLDLAKMVTKQVPKQRMATMSELKLKSNFARDKVVMLDGIHPVKFDDRGEARCPAHMREAVERLMTAKPGRFWLVEEVASAQVSVPDMTLEEIALVQKAVEEEVELELEEVPKEIDQSFLVEEKPDKKRGRKKSRSEEE